MSIGASEHRTFVRAKARFAGPKAQEHSFVRRNAVLQDILPCIVAGIFWRKVPRVPCPSRSPSVRPARSHSIPVAPARPSAAFTSARCEPISVFPLLPGPSTRPAWPSAASVAAGYEPFSENRLTPASRDSGFWPGTMAAGAREQAASCDAFVLSRRLPAPDAPPIRKSPACLVAKPFPEPRPGLWLSKDCRGEFRQARLGPSHPDGVLAVVGVTDRVWQGGSVMSTLRRGPREASRNDRG